MPGARGRYRPPKPKPEISPTGPYRAQSSVKKIREKATPTERRVLSRGKSRTAKRVRRLEAQDRRSAAKAKRREAKAQGARSPIETLKRAEAKLAKQSNPKLREASRRLRHALAEEAAFKARRRTAEGTAIEANKPKADLKEVAPRAYEKARRAALPGGHGSSGGAKADPLAEFAISTAATGGLGLAGKAVGLAGKAGAEAAAAKLASKEATASEELATQAAKRIVARAKGATKAKAAAKAERVRTAPQRAVRGVKRAPSRAKRAATTSEGRRAAARGAARGAAKRPVKTSVGAAAASPVPLPAEADKRARAFLKGEAAAALGHPGKYARTTAEAGLGFLTFPLSVAGAGVQSAKEGSLAPLGKEAKDTVAGTKKMVTELASGDPKRVERSALQESGAIPFIPVPHVLRRLKGTKTYEDARARVRGSVEGKRAKTRGRLEEAEKASQESGAFVGRKKARKVKQSIPDTARQGEHYVVRSLGRLTEKQRSRHWIAREFARIKREQEHGKAAGEHVAKPLRKSKGTNQAEQNFGEALRIVGKYGLPRNEGAGMAFVRKLHEGFPQGEHGKVPAGAHLDRHSTAFILEHPELFKDRHFWESVERLDHIQKEVGTSPRNQFQAQVDSLINPLRQEQGRPALLKPEEMVTPEALRLLPKRDVRQFGEWSRSKAFDFLAELKRKGDGRSQVRAAALQKALDDAGNGERLMRPPEHGGAAGGVSTTRSVPWTPEMLKRHLNQVKPELKRLGLREPTPYLADVLPSEMKGAEPNYGGMNALGKAWPSRGIAAKSGNALSDFESTIYHSVIGPRARNAFKAGLNRIFDKASRKVEGRRYLTRKQVEHAINTHQWPHGTVPVRTQMLRSLIEGERPVDPVEFRQALFGEIEHGRKLVSGAKDELRGEIEAVKAAGTTGEKFAPMDAVAMRELMGHMEGPKGVSVGMGHVSNFATRTILNSPAFEISQFAQEGIPGAMALGRDVVHIPKALKALKAINKLPLAEQAQIKAVFGSSVGILGSPHLKGVRSEGFMDPARAAGSKQAWRHAWEIVNGSKLSRFDRARAGAFREVAGLAKIEGDLRRAEKGFQGWRRSAKNLFKHQQRAVEDMKGMPPEARALYISEHPRLGDELIKDMHGMMGNWDAFTTFEKNISPFAIFYPFQRYSVLWMLYHFPLDHPVVSTGLAMLGAVNAQELRKIAAREGGTPSVLDYTKPVIAGGSVLPSGQRFFPGLGAIQQAVLEGKPMQALQSASPALSIPIESLTGKNAYTNAPLGESGLEHLLRSGANLSPLLRFLGAPDIGKGKSPGSQAFGALDPLRSQRSFVNPFIGQSPKQFAKTKRLEKDFTDKYGEGNIPGPFDSPMVIDLLYGGPGGTPQPKKLPEVLRKIHGAERASGRVKKAEEPFLPKGKPFSPLQKQLLQAVEDAWQTGPGAAGSSNSFVGGGSSSKNSFTSKQSTSNSFLGG